MYYVYICIYIYICMYIYIYILQIYAYVLLLPNILMQQVHCQAYYSVASRGIFLAKFIHIKQTETKS